MVEVDVLAGAIADKVNVKGGRSLDLGIEKIGMGNHSDGFDKKRWQCWCLKGWWQVAGGCELRHLQYR